MSFSHVLLTRPGPQSAELAGLLEPMGLQPVVQPAFDHAAVDARTVQAADFAALESAPANSLLLFTSPRAVEHGLPQFPPAVVARARVGAVGPSTARILSAAGVRVGIRASRGYTSEDLLASLSASLPPRGGLAFIVAAPGGRHTLAEGLARLGWDVRMLMVYGAAPATLDREGLSALESAGRILSVWTSANAMKSLSQRLPPRTWFRVCQGEWVVISDRLQRLARAYSPARIHTATGPDNQSIAATVRSLL